MNPNSFLSQNEFMPAAQQPADPTFDNFMQACLNNPSFFQSMRQFYTQANQPKINNSFQSNPSQLPKKEQVVEDYEVEDELQSISQKQFRKQSKKLPANPLLKYQPQPSPINVEQPNANNRRLPQQAVKNSFEERPIQSKYTQSMGGSITNKGSFDLNAIKQNQSINIDIQERPNKQTKETARNFDDQPVRGMKTEDREYQTDERPIKAMDRQDLEYYQQIPKQYAPKTSNNTAISKSNVIDDDRPLTGAKKDFKELLKQQFPEPFGQEIEGEVDQGEEKKVEPRNFLKRGSRQHLSSAISRGKQLKKKQQLDKSGLDNSRDITPNKSTSQNRILAKKNNNNDKSVSKPIPKQDDEPRIPKAVKPPTSNNSKKTEPMPVKTVAKIEPVQGSKKKKKNVFDDDSSSSSSQEEAYFKQSSKPLPLPEEDDRMQVIEGVLLTKAQLQQILQRHAPKQLRQESESEKIQAIRNKYTELCQLVETQRQAHQAQLQKDREEFEKYKAEQLAKIKNERRVMERQLKTGPGTSLQRQKEELESLKLQLEKEREDFKKKDKNNRIIIEKYRKENEDLKARIERIQGDRESAIASKKSLNTYKSQEPEEKPIRQPGKVKKEEEEITYKDIKKAKEVKQEPKKMRYDYAEEQTTSNHVSTHKETKIQNKWLTNRHSSDSESQKSSDHEEEEKEESGAVWSPAMKLSDLTKLPLSIKMVSEPMINALFRYDTNLEYRRYQQLVKAPTRTVVNSNRNSRNSFVVNLYNDRSKEHIYDNGTRKETLENGYTIVYFRNGDIKQTLPDQTILYYFKQKAVDQITLPNGLNIYRFDNNQVEFHFPNGNIEIRHPDGTIRLMGEVSRR